MLSPEHQSTIFQASIVIDGKTENYRGFLTACANPVCTCRIVTLDMTPDLPPGETDFSLKQRLIVIDLENKKLAYENWKIRSEDDLSFGELFLGQMDDDDFQLLESVHGHAKNKITEAANPESIEADFDYGEVESSGMMYGYNEVLPYADQLLFTVSNRFFVVIDQYCVRTKCPCVDATLVFIEYDNIRDESKEVLAASVNYVAKKWEIKQNHLRDLDFETIKSALLEAFPDFFKKLKSRHTKLKLIYAHCKQKNYAPKPVVASPALGRNAPCPCGSGKKYKKCCLGK
ncbi:MAG: SEC-C metal-binding domain-containing protein [Pseudomonadota bacterium]